MRPVLCVWILALPLLAQFPGQYPTGPFPGGGGQYPGGGRRNPNGTGTNGPGRSQPGRSSKDKAKDQPVVTTTEGLLRRFVSNQIVIEAEDHRVIWYHLSDKMTYEEGGKDLDPKSLTPGDRVSVDSTADDQDVYFAVSLTRRSAGTAEDRRTVSRDWDLPPLFSGQQIASAQAPKSITREPGDDRPVLRRSKPAADDVPKADDSQNTPAKEPEKAAAPPVPSQDVKQAAAPPEEPEDTRPATTLRPPDPKPDADDPGRPVLKRGGSAPRRAATQSDAPNPTLPQTSAGPIAPTVATPAATRDAGGPGPRLGAAAPPTRDLSAVPIEDDAVIAKAREAAAMYLEGLPNFFAKQMTTRYATENIKQGWQAQDVITADVAYEEGHESYKNIKIGNKATNKSMEELPGHGRRVSSLLCSSN